MRSAVITHRGRIPAGSTSDHIAIQHRDDLSAIGEEVRVRVLATALNRADILQIRGLYPAPPGAPPDVPGLEFVGVVDQRGEKARDFEVGERVFGLVGGGAFAEQVVTHQRAIVRVPEKLSDVEAAAVPEAFITAHDALATQAGMKAGDLVLVHAVASGVGSAAVQLVHLWGARAIGTAGSARKLEAIGALAPFHPVDYTREDFKEAIEREFGEHPLDIVLDLLGGNYWKRNVELLNGKGRLMLVGLLDGSTAETPLALVLRRRLQLRGTVLRSRSLEEKIAVTRAFAAEVVPHVAAGRVRPVIDSVFPFDDLAAGIARMERRENIGKIVFTMA